jgi:YHS domain-containing protein
VEPLPVARESRDPICGMMVEITTARYRSTVADRTVYFCCLACKETFDRAPEEHLASLDE